MTTLFQNTIESLLAAHGLLQAFQQNDSFHVRLDQPGYERLVIERYGDLISVAHYYEQNGDLVPDPDVELHHPSWVPTAITQAYGGYRQKFFERNGQTCVDTRFHKEVSAFLALWARNLQAQDWAHQGQVHDEDLG